MVGQSVARKANGPKVIIALGMGEFQSSSGGIPSLHTAFGGYSVAKVYHFILAIVINLAHGSLSPQDNSLFSISLYSSAL